MNDKLTAAQIVMLHDAEPTLFGGVKLRKLYGRSIAAFKRKALADEGAYLTPAGIEIYNEVTGGQ